MYKSPSAPHITKKIVFELSIWIIEFWFLSQVTDIP